MIWQLLIVMQLKHYIADYLLQGEYMLGKFKEKGWVLPLSAHCFVHFLSTVTIANISGLPYLISVTLGMLDFSIHFIMDRIKASAKMMGRWSALSKGEMISLLKSEHKMRHCNLPPKTKNEFLKETYERKMNNVFFWWSLGFDQLVHHLTDILIVFLILEHL